MKNAFVDDHVVPQLFTTAIEAYEFAHKSTANGKGYDGLETFGLLWGVSVPAKGESPSKIIASIATAETSALRHSDWVKPNFDSIRAKKEFFGKYWPNVELVGTFHSHPYDSLRDVNSVRGWQGSSEDLGFWPHFHEEISPEQDSLLHLVVAITQLERRGWGTPSRLAGGEVCKGYVVSAGYRKLWLRAYSTEVYFEGGDDDSPCYLMRDDVCLEIPALEKRFE